MTFPNLPSPLIMESDMIEVTSKSYELMKLFTIAAFTVMFLPYTALSEINALRTQLPHMLRSEFTIRPDISLSRPVSRIDVFGFSLLPLTKLLYPCISPYSVLFIMLSCPPKSVVNDDLLT